MIWCIHDIERYAKIEKDVVDSGDIEPPPPVVKGISGKYIVGIAKLKTGFVVILDINQIFSTEEIMSL